MCILKKYLTKYLCVVCLLGYFAASSAADGIVSGKVSRLDAVGGLGSAPGNADTRVYISGVSTFCPGTVTDATWAYVNSNDPNYKGMLATLLFAYASNKTLQVYSRATAVGSGVYCQMSYINVIG